MARLRSLTKSGASFGGSAEAPGAKADDPAAASRVLFVTGRLAEPALGRVLAEMAPSFAYEVAPLKITVAALMTTPWIARFLEVSRGTDLVLIPGLCEGDPGVIADKVGVRVEKGPKDLREIPRYFGQAAAAREYGAWDIEIIAEINNAPRLPGNAVRQAADYFRTSGADIIDIGCTPGLPFPALGSLVRELAAAGMRVSVDTFDPDEIRTAVAAGAELVLSVNGSNIDVAQDLTGTGARVVVLPDLGGSLDTLEPSLEALARWGVPYLIDPILEPIGHGFMASLERYAEVRRRYPDAEMLMGIGNLTELTAADTTGVNALLVAICQELGIRTVLTTEVAPWARGAVREVEVARRLMHYAVTRQVIPKGVDDRLVTVKDPAILTYSEEELRALQAGITDPNFRIFADPGGITVLNRERFVRGTDIQEIFGRLEVDDPAHAFYLGKELARASLAMTLGKTYRQEGALAWGYLTPEDDARSKPNREAGTQKRGRHVPVVIVETVVTSVAADGTVNCAPMGVEWGDTEIVLKPFLDTATYRNLISTRACVVNLTDDVRLFARAAISSPVYPTIPAEVVRGVVLADCCSWREVEVRAVDSTPPRSRIETMVVHRGIRREFIGFNRAQHAVLETAIYATRLHLLPRAFIDSELVRLQVIVDKTAGAHELEAMALLTEYIHSLPAGPDPA